MRWEVDDQAGVGRAACGGSGRGRFSVRGRDCGMEAVWSLNVRESGKCESEKCGVCRVGFSNFWLAQAAKHMGYRIFQNPNFVCI